MTVFALNLLLAVLWAMIRGVEVPNLVVGFLLAYLVLWTVRPVLGDTAYFRKTGGLLRFAVFLLVELILANLRVARDVLSPRPRRRPGVVAVPLEARTDVEITLLANLITLTPGSLSLEVSEDRRVLFVHSMFVDSPEGLREEIKTGFERRLLELLR